MGQQQFRQPYPPGWYVPPEAQQFSRALRQFFYCISQLRAYCHLDTLAMVEIHRSLLTLSQAGQA